MATKYSTQKMVGDRIVEFSNDGEEWVKYKTPRGESVINFHPEGGFTPRTTWEIIPHV